MHNANSENRCIRRIRGELMEKIKLWRMDVAAEIVMCVVLALILVTCFTQKKSLSTTKPLTILVFVDLLLMLCQLAGWGMGSFFNLSTLLQNQNIDDIILKNHAGNGVMYHVLIQTSFCEIELLSF